MLGYVEGCVCRGVWGGEGGGEWDVLGYVEDVCRGSGNGTCLGL